MALVSIYSQVYNTEQYLPQCIESVLSQTFRDFTFYLINNGSTDSSLSIMQHYAEKDERITILHFPTNGLGLWKEVALNTGDGEYMAVIDSDDWWDSGYLEKMVGFVQDHDLDMACTGCVFHPMPDGPLSVRQAKQAAVIDRALYAQAFPYYHVFLRTNWGKLFRSSVYHHADIQKCLEARVYGSDTLLSFEILRGCARIGIDGLALYHYRVRQKSNSYQYRPHRFESDLYLYDDAVRFLELYGPVSNQNQDFLRRIFLNAVSDTLDVLAGADIPPAQKLKELKDIAVHPLIQSVYRVTDEEAVRNKLLLLSVALPAGADCPEEKESFHRIVKALSPGCGAAVTVANASLFTSSQTLFHTLLHDDRDAMLKELLDMIEQKQNTKRYNLGEAVRALAVDDPLLSQVTNLAFLRSYRNIYQRLWQGERMACLDEMTGLLLENRVHRAAETFLQIYISLAAIEESPAAFIFGKIQLAKLFFSQNRRGESQALLAELDEMGVTDNDSVESLRMALGDQA